MEYVTMLIASQTTAMKLHRMDSLAWHTGTPWSNGTAYVLASTGANMVRHPKYTMRGLCYICNAIVWR